MEGGTTEHRGTADTHIRWQHSMLVLSYILVCGNYVDRVLVIPFAL